MPPSRREFLADLLCASAGLGLLGPAVSCGGSPRPATGASSPMTSLRVDDTLAWLTIEGSAGRDAEWTRARGALETLVRHARMTGATGASADTVIDRLLFGPPLDLGGAGAVHEVHHVGFLAHRPWPDLSLLAGPSALAEAIRFLTHLEGMAVHAVAPGRRAAGDLDRDADYAAYADPAAVVAVAARCDELLTEVETATVLAPGDVDRILEGMSSGERLWYRLGAAVCDRLEREQGRGFLAGTVTAPEGFHEAAGRLRKRVAGRDDGGAGLAGRSRRAMDRRAGGEVA